MPETLRRRDTNSIDKLLLRQLHDLCHCNSGTNRADSGSNMPAYAVMAWIHSQAEQALHFNASDKGADEVGTGHWLSSA